jgi:aldehyde dehydrogenase (NAD+)
MNETGDLRYGAGAHDTSRVREWLESLGEVAPHYLGGVRVVPKGPKRLDVLEPATGSTLTTIAEALPDEIETALDAAQQASEVWASIDNPRRVAIVRQLASTLTGNSKDLALLEAVLFGKPVRNVLESDIPTAVSSLVRRADELVLADPGLGTWRGAGVVAFAIDGVGFLPDGLTAMAQLLGASVVIVASGGAALAALRLAELLTDSGLPPGMLGVLTGGRDTVRALASNERIEGLAAVGPADTVRQVRAAAGGHLPIAVEAQQSSTWIIVTEEADLDAAAESACEALKRFQALHRAAGTHLLVEESVADTFLDRLLDRLGHARVGDPASPLTDIGPVGSDRAGHLASLCSEMLKLGARCLSPMAIEDAPQAPRLVRKGEQDGAWFHPVVLYDVSASVQARHEAGPGPLLFVSSYRTPPEAVGLANGAATGRFEASVWCDDITQALEMAVGLHSRSVSINCLQMAEGLDRGQRLTAMRPWSAVRAGSASRAGAVLRLVADGDGGVTSAVSSAAADAATAQWRSLSPNQRADALRSVADLIEARAYGLAAIAAETHLHDLEESSRVSDMEAAIAELVEQWRRWASRAARTFGSSSRHDTRGLHTRVRVPLGVVGLACEGAQLLTMLTRLGGALLSAGNSAVVAAHPRESVLVAELEALLSRARVPRGTLAFVTGEGSEIALAMAGQDGIDALWLLDSSAGMSDIAARAAESLKPMHVLPAEVLAMDLDGEDEITLLMQATEVKDVHVAL